jgi:diketogulonate reductase-like aldo/keto reductase
LLYSIGFAATAIFSDESIDVWSPHGHATNEEIGAVVGSRLDSFDLVQVYNLPDVHTHLDTLPEWKGSGRLRYLGVTISRGRRHGELEKLTLTGALDFVQFTYNMIDREAEQRLLPIARKHGIGVIANRPFRTSRVFDHVSGATLSNWARDFDYDNWAQFFLKFIVSHPAVTCAIPTTSRPQHMVENMRALVGRLPDSAMRKQMAALYAAL